ncbi:hypothetical protein OMAG_001340 [Candidatus Omnitrophus magneticus]|uniref:Uncharacterized protein n=1 Tax=Candidatus Omnitrophus magneticus TaxID=1609969 RepID=A0A0F0CTP4_9BACT|nr:hypothetical protein OMAG_001340 [Candidatus Omnitrophus magneticus]
MRGANYASDNIPLVLYFAFLGIDNPIIILLNKNFLTHFIIS